MTPDTVDEVDDLALAKPSRRYRVKRQVKAWFIGWFLFAALVGVIADSRGRSGMRWWLLSVLISPLLGVVLIVLLPPLKRPAGASAGQLAQGARVVQDRMGRY